MLVHSIITPLSFSYGSQAVSHLGSLLGQASLALEVELDRVPSDYSLGFFSLHLRELKKQFGNSEGTASERIKKTGMHMNAVHTLMGHNDLREGAFILQL